MLRTLGAAAGLPALGLGASTRKRVGIIGGVMAGVALAWLLDGDRDVVLLEARSAIGGNVQSVEVDVDGQPFLADLGAQYFHPGPSPLYTALLTALGLYPPVLPPPALLPGFDHADRRHCAGAAVRFAGAATAIWPLFASWNTPGVVAFATALAAAKRREQENASWALTLGDWLRTLGLSQDQWEGMLLAWTASLFSGDIDQARGFRRVLR